jgi:putative endonuclease
VYAAARGRASLGRAGEEAVERFLEARGHRVVARRFRTRRGEVDLVTESGGHIYFVEVKTRRDEAFGPVEHAVSDRKLARVWRAAEQFLAKQPRPLVPHLGVATVRVHGAHASIRFVPDAC